MSNSLNTVQSNKTMRVKQVYSPRMFTDQPLKTLPDEKTTAFN
jgi:hypothetical protein